MDIPAEYLIFKINILKRIFLVTLAVSLGAMLFGQKGFALGFCVGGLLSIAIFSLFYKYVLAIRGLEPPARKRFIVTKALLIYFLMGLALFIGIKKGITVFLGTATGLFSMKLAVFIQVFQERNVIR